MTPLLAIAIMLLLASAGLIVLAFTGVIGGSGKMHHKISQMVASQRDTTGFRRPGVEGERPRLNEMRDSELNQQKARFSCATITLEKRLRYADWKIEPKIFRLAQIAIGVVSALIMSQLLNTAWVIASMFFGYLLMGGILNYKIQKRFKKFDGDFAPFLLSLVGLLKTGMTPLQAIDAATVGLDEDSLVKHEARLMVERLRLGVSEDKSVGAFAEGVSHAEIELFVQALLLSRRVGGTLSDTLERLSKQVRKRQYFRNSAQAAVSMQRGSVWAILGILVALEGYIYWTYPVLVTKGLEWDVGWQIWQIAILLICLGIFWLQQVTKIRV